MQSTIARNEASVNKPRSYAMLAVLTSLAIFLLIVLLPVIVMANDNSFFEAQFSAYNVYQQFPGQSLSQLNDEFAQILAYMNFRQPQLDSGFYSREDILHMADVRGLMLGVYVLTGLASSLLLALVAAKQWQLLYRGISGALVLTIVTVILISVASLLNFNALFIDFHQVMFSNNYWQLDPATSRLIRYLPEQLFAQILGIILLSSSFLSIVVAGIAFLFKRYYRHETQQAH